MYTVASDQLALSLELGELIVNPSHGQLVRMDGEGLETADFSSTTNYVYVPDSDFIGEDTFAYYSNNKIQKRVSIHVNQTTSGHKVFIPCIK